MQAVVFYASTLINGQNPSSNPTNPYDVNGFISGITPYYIADFTNVNGNQNTTTITIPDPRTLGGIGSGQGGVGGGGVVSFILTAGIMGQNTDPATVQLILPSPPPDSSFVMQGVTYTNIYTYQMCISSIYQGGSGIPSSYPPLYTGISFQYNGYGSVLFQTKVVFFYSYSLNVSTDSSGNVTNTSNFTVYQN
jgi:hypothetical protein